MSQMVEGNTKSFKVGATALARGTRVKLSSNLLVAAGLADRHIGVMTARGEIGDHAGVYLPGMAGTCQFIAADSLSALATVYTAADGKVSDSPGAGCYRIGTALESASGDGSIIEVALDGSLSRATAVGKATAVAGDDTAGYIDIDTGLGAISSCNVMILRGGVVVSLDQVVTITAGVIRVADGASTYDVTAGDVIHWQAWA